MSEVSLKEKYFLTVTKEQMAIDEKINSRNIHKSNANDELHGYYSFVEGNKFLSQLVSFSLALYVPSRRTT